MKAHKGREYYIKALECIKDNDYNNMSLWMTKSADLGYNEAIKRIYSNDLWMKQDFAITRPFYEEVAYDSSIVDNSFSLNMLGYIYKFGLSVEVNISKAKKLYKMAINKGNYYSMHNLACIYDKDLGTKYKKCKILVLASWKMGCIRGICNLADIYYKMGKYQKAIKLYKLSGKLGIYQSFVDLGHIYRDGVVIEQNYSKSLKYYNKAANQGYPSAFCGLGYMYHNGLGTEINYTKAMKFYGLAIEGDEPMAYHNLAFMYEYGKGVENNYKKALELYRESSLKGNNGAIIKLAELFFDGSLIFEVEQDYEQARLLYEKSFKEPTDGALLNLIKIYDKGLGISKDILKALQLCTLMIRHNKDSVVAIGQLTHYLGIGMDGEGGVS